MQLYRECRRRVAEYPAVGKLQYARSRVQKGARGRDRRQKLGMPPTNGVPEEVWEPVWTDLSENQGWRIEYTPRRCTYTYKSAKLYMPPGVFRGDTGVHVNRDYFDSRPQVLQHVQAPGYKRTVPPPPGSATALRTAAASRASAAAVQAANAAAVAVAEAPAATEVVEAAPAPVHARADKSAGNDRLLRKRRKTQDATVVSPEASVRQAHDESYQSDAAQAASIMADMGNNDELRAEFVAYIQRHKALQIEVSEWIGYSNSVVSQWKLGRSGRNTAMIDQLIRDWMQAHSHARETGQPVAPGPAAVKAAAVLAAIVKKPQSSPNSEELWLADLAVGDKVSARDKVWYDDTGVWHPATVVDATKRKVKVRYQGFEKRPCQWMDRDLLRLQPHATEDGTEEEEKQFEQNKHPKRQRTELNPSPCFSPLGLPEIIGDSTSIYIGKHKLRIGLLDPPRVVVRDVVSFVCDLTDKESAALDVSRSMTRTIQCVAYMLASVAHIFSSCTARIIH